jgi:hypothetical protein
MTRIAHGAASQTAVRDLAHAASVLAHAKREGLVQNASGQLKRAHRSQLRVRE